MQDHTSKFLNPENIIKQIGLEPGMIVADFGCGSGYKTFAASRAVGKQGRILAIDVQKSVLDQVEKEARIENFNNIEVIWADLEVSGSTNIAQNTVDVIFLVNLLFQINDKKAVFKEARRIIKKNGKALVIDWKKGNTGIGPNIDKRVDLANIKQIAQEFGFSEEKEIQAGKYHFGVLFRL